MNVQDFFYLAHYDNHFVDNLLTTLLNRKLLKKHYSTSDNVHFFDLQLLLDEKFFLENFDTPDINEVTLIRLSKVCVQNAITVQPISDIINEVRIKSSFYPLLKNAKISLLHDDVSKQIKVDYAVTIVLIPDHLSF